MIIDKKVDDLEKNNKMYIFQGYKFLDYVDYEIFKKEIENVLAFKANNEEQFAQFYTRFLKGKNNIKQFNELLFSHILYGKLKNIYVNKFNNLSFSEDKIKEKNKNLLNQFNLTNRDIPFDFYNLMNESGFYLLDSLNINIKGAKFIAGLDYSIDENKKVKTARYLFVQAVPKRNTLNMEYLLAGVEIDFLNHTYLIMVRNLSNDIETVESQSHWDTTVNAFYKKVDDAILSNLGIKPVLDVKKDRNGMFLMCQELDNKLLSDIRIEVKSKSEDIIKKFADEIFNKLSLDRDSNYEKNLFTEKVQSLVIGSYINTNFKPRDIKLKAKKMNLVGYSTRIFIKSNKLNQSSTKTNSANNPIASSEAFHSLYTDFSQSSNLRDWAMSWFTNLQKDNPKDPDVIQTSIVSTTKYFKVVFLPTRHLNKELIYHVIGNINKYRNY